jgi:dienelactone hydrolase
MKRPLYLLLLAVVPLLLGTAVWSCSDSSGSAPASDTTPAADTKPPPPPIPTTAEVNAFGSHSVGVTTLILVDDSRPTGANGDFEGAPDRTLVTWIWYPAAPQSAAPGSAKTDAPVNSTGPYPVVMYSHGFMCESKENEALGRYLASHGLIVVAPTYPLTSRDAPGGPTFMDVINQPGDIAFLIDRMEAFSQDDTSLFFGAVDTQRVAAMGLSLGGLTSALAGHHPLFADPRINVVTSVAGALCVVPPDSYRAGTATLFLYGETDQIANYTANGADPYQAAKSPKMLVTLLGGTHVGFAGTFAQFLDGVENPDQVGCAALLDTLKGQTLSGLVDAFGFEEGQTNVESCVEPCSGEAVEQTMKPSRQMEISQAVVGAFLRAHLSDDAQAMVFLTDGVGAENADVNVLFE